MAEVLSVARPALATGAIVAASVSYISYFCGGWASAFSASRRRRCLEIPPGWGQGKVVLVTGGAGAIGLRTAQALAKAGATVIIGCRSLERGAVAKSAMSLSAEASARVEVVKLDLASIKSIQAFGQAFRTKHTSLDVLVLNAGVARSFLGTGGFGLTEDGFEEMMGVNFLGHFLLTGLLLPVLRRTPGSRVIGLTSVAMGNSYACGIDVQSWTSRRADFKDWKQYGQSKLAVRLFIRELQRREPSVLCLACHPGVVAETGLMHQGKAGLLEWLYSLLMFKLFAMSPDHSHITSVYLATAPAEDLEGGACYQPLGRKLPWMTHWLQRLGALQAPVAMKTSHPGLFDDAERLLNERASASLGAPLLPAKP
mmetsp:Transcript_34172/g.101978  ORF Transcript_34172/g.101978 Transcript_34172/m.101978 type:complete len:369 (-) Transcript_34172:38-1144(-)